MSFSRVLVLALCSLLLLVSTALAGMTVTGQSRNVSANGYVEDYDTGETDSDGESHVAPDLTPFVQGAGATASLSNGYVNASGTQNSSIGPNSVTAFGTCGMSAESYDFNTDASAGAQSELSVTFQITGTVAYSLTGLISAYDNGYTELLLSGNSGTIYFQSASSQEVNVNQSGTLGPGTYSIYAQTSGGAYANQWMDYASGDYQFTLLVTSSTSTEDGVETQSFGRTKASFR